MSCRKILSSVLALSLAAATPALAENKLTTGITGSTPADPRRNPSEILSSPEIQDLVLDIATHPKSRDEVEAAVAAHFFDVDDMIAVGLLREEGGELWVDFNLLLQEDQRRILELTEVMGRDLAEALLEHRSEFEAFAAAHDQPRALPGELLYLVLGCFSLDWDGLDLTEENGWRDAAQRTIDGYSFTPWAKEKGVDLSLKGLYWGSHNYTAGSYKATTFGDHDALPRFGFPDLLWGAGRAYRDLDDSEARLAAAYALSTYALEMLPDVAAILTSLRHGNLAADELAERTGIEEEKLGRLLALLEATEYVELVDGAYEATVVVLLEEDSATVDAIRQLGREVMIRWHEENYERIREDLSDLTPGVNGVPFERVYTEIWHFAFGIANRTLVERGLFADPYAETRRHQGFIPAIWADGLSD
jgi:hypothetical protein